MQTGKPRTLERRATAELSLREGGIEQMYGNSMPDAIGEPETCSPVRHAGDDDSVSSDPYGEDSDADSPEQDN